LLRARRAPAHQATCPDEIEPVLVKGVGKYHLTTPLTMARVICIVCLDKQTTWLELAPSKR
jgi:hypothetical protein